MKFSLTFWQLRLANTRRLPLFTNAKGEPAHTEPDGSDWTPADWMTATMGELGEAANVMKKIRRGDFTLDEARKELADEFADVIIYMDIMAKQMGIDLDGAVITKWNQTSRKVNVPLRLTHDGRLDEWVT